MGKQYTITFNYNNLNLDVVKVNNATYNLGAGIRLYVDGKLLNLGGTLPGGDTSY